MIRIAVLSHHGSRSDVRGPPRRPEHPARPQPAYGLARSAQQHVQENVPHVPDWSMQAQMLTFGPDR